MQTWDEGSGGGHWSLVTGHLLAGLLDQGDGDEDPSPQEDESQKNDPLNYTNDDHCGDRQGDRAIRRVDMFDCYCASSI